MASAVPKLDVSVTDARWDCVSCPYRHKPGSECPRPRRWLASGAVVQPPSRTEVADAA